MKKTTLVIICIIMVMMLHSCVGCDSKTTPQTTNTQIVQDTTILKKTDEATQIKACEKVNDQQIFYPIFSDTIYIYRRFCIINNELVLNYLDMESDGYQGVIEREDSLINITVHKRLSLSDYDEGEIVLYDFGDSYAPKTISLIKDKKSYVWKILMDGKPYKFDAVVDSLDMHKSKYYIDTTNYWLSE